MNSANHLAVADRLLERACRTADWLEACQQCGWDLFDVRDTWFGRACRGLQARRVRGPGWLLRQIEEHRPATVRRILSVQPRRYPKGIALSCQAYAMLHRLDPSGPWSRRCTRWLAWLRAHPSPGYGAAWGYPHYWRSEVPIPARTPSGVVSTACGWAFLEAYRTWGRDEDREMAVRVAASLVARLRQVPAAVGFCFSYTPIDAICCHNANLLTAAYLADVCALERHPDWEALARGATLYTLSHQESDGSFRYFGAPQRGWRRSMIDHVHTGFVLRSLAKLRPLLPDRVGPALSACYQHYVTHCFGADGWPRPALGQTYPLDVHCVAEAALVAAEFAACDAGAIARGVAALEIGERLLALGDGSYRPRRGRRPPRQAIAYVRWGAAWMLLAHARLAAASRNGLATG